MPRYNKAPTCFADKAWNGLANFRAIALHVVRWRCSTWQKRNQENGIAQKTKQKTPQKTTTVLTFVWVFPHQNTTVTGLPARGREYFCIRLQPSFQVACQTPKKGQSLRCVVEWSVAVGLCPLCWFWMMCGGPRLGLHFHNGLTKSFCMLSVWSVCWWFSCSWWSPGFCVLYWWCYRCAGSILVHWWWWLRGISACLLL